MSETSRRNGVTPLGSGSRASRREVSVPILVDLPAELEKRMRELALSENRTESELTVDAIQEYLLKAAG